MQIRLLLHIRQLFSILPQLLQYALIHHQTIKYFDQLYNDDKLPVVAIQKKQVIYDSDEQQIDLNEPFYFDDRVQRKRKPLVNALAKNNIFVTNQELPTYRSGLKFPSNRQLFQYIDNEKKLKELLSAQLKRQKLFIEIKVFGSRVGHAIHVVCISCNKKLLLKYLSHQDDDQPYRHKLVYFDNSHTHDGDTRFMLNKESRFNLIMQEWSEHTNMTMDEFYRYLKKKFQVGRKELQYFLTLAYEKRDQEMKALLVNLKKHNSKVWMIAKLSKGKIERCDQVGELDVCIKDPEFFMFSLPFMQENAQKYGSICYITIFQGYIENKDKHGKKSWEVITFTGLSQGSDLAPYAVAFLDTSEHSTNTITEITKKFMREFKLNPRLIITPYREIFNEVVVRLREELFFKGMHFYDAICYIQSLGEQLEHLVDRIHYQQIILSKTRAQFNLRCKSLFKRVEPTAKNIVIFNRMVSLAPKMIFSHIETDQFIGLTFRFSGSKHFHNLMRQIFTKGRVRQQDLKGEVIRKKWKNIEPGLIKSVNLVLRAMLRLNTVLNSEESRKSGYVLWRSQNYLDMPQLQPMRIHIKKEYMDILLQQYGYIFQIQANQRPLKDPQLPQMRIFDLYDRRQNSLFVVSAQPQYDANTKELTNFRWRCNCLFSYKSGIPCAHEVKACVLTGSSIFSQVHEKWVKMRFFPPNMKKRGRTKGTRRNTEK